MQLIPILLIVSISLLIFGCTMGQQEAKEVPLEIRKASEPPSGISKPEAKCEDNDGKDIFTSDTIYANGKKVIEKCTSTGKAEEYYCDGNELKKEILPCPSGYSCFFGACVPEKEKCLDSDGEGIYGQGRVDAGGEAFIDECSGINNVREYICQSGSPAPKVFQCPPRTICREGACIPFVTTCRDSEIGRNYTEAGMVTVDDGSGFLNVSKDICQNTTTLMEYYCTGKNESYDFFNCPCKDGACRTDTICTDTDALTREVKGEVRVSPLDDNKTAIVNPDVCLDYRNVKEFYCEKNAAKSVILPCSVISDKSYCEDGVCVVAENDY